MGPHPRQAGSSSSSLAGSCPLQCVFHTSLGVRVSRRTSSVGHLPQPLLSVFTAFHPWSLLVVCVTLLARDFDTLLHIFIYNCFFIFSTVS